MTENGLERDAALAAVDDALATGRVTAADPRARELQDLALAIEAESELPRDEYARELDARVTAGFPRRRARLPASLPSPPRGRALALAGAAATLLVVIGVALSSSSEEPGPGDVAVVEQPSVAVPETVPPATDQAESSGGAGRARVAPGERERRIERSAELTLAAPDGELDDVADSIVRVTDRHRGFVLRSSVASGEDSERGGSFDLRVPADSLQAALRDLSRLGHVRARRQAGRDVTPAFVSARDRLEAARAERRSLLRRLARAQTDRQAEQVRVRLDAVSLRIERLRRELGAVRERTDYAAVAVELEGTGGDGGGTGGGTRDAFDDALGLLEGSLGLALRALGVLIPLAIVGGLGWLGGRLLRRRRREAVLR
ncbi:MAG TPA: DUF4349 domain-containing protein [Thermoleophilaceae bacterium]|jgi:hypothetical protein